MSVFSLISRNFSFCLVEHTMPRSISQIFCQKFVDLTPISRKILPRSQMLISGWHIRALKHCNFFCEGGSKAIEWFHKHFAVYFLLSLLLNGSKMMAIFWSFLNAITSKAGQQSFTIPTTSFERIRNAFQFTKKNESLDLHTTPPFMFCFSFTGK